MNRRDAIAEAMRRQCELAEQLGLTLGTNVFPIWLARAKRAKALRTYTRPMPTPPRAA